MNENFTFIIIGLQPWYTAIGSNCKQIAQQLAKHHQVLYVNASLDRRSVLKKDSNKDIAQHLSLIKNGKGHVHKIEENLWEYYPARILESINWIPNTWLFQKINYLNNKRFAKDIEDAIALMNIKEYYLFNDNEIFRAFYLKDLLKPKGYIYYCRDYLLGVDYWKKHGQKLEPLHIAHADFAMANSTYLAQYLSQYNKEAVDMGQGCDTILFDGKIERNLPQDMSNLKEGVKVGYVGALNSLRLDIEGLIYLAKNKPTWQLILVGPEDEDFKNSALHQLENVYFLGQKPVHELPNYIAGFDVCLNPQKINEVTIGNYPLKIDEYLNMGKPVVATYTQAMTLFEPYTYLAKDAKEYPALIEKALAEDNEEQQQRRMAFASQHTWENSVNKMLNALSNS